MNYFRCKIYQKKSGRHRVTLHVNVCGFPLAVDDDCFIFPHFILISSKYSRRPNNDRDKKNVFRMATIRRIFRLTRKTRLEKKLEQTQVTLCHLLSKLHDENHRVFATDYRMN